MDSLIATSLIQPETFNGVDDSMTSRVFRVIIITHPHGRVKL